MEPLALAEAAEPGWQSRRSPSARRFCKLCPLSGARTCVPALLSLLCERGGRRQSPPSPNQRWPSRRSKATTLMARGKENGCHIHDAGKRNGGVVQEPEGNQPQAAEVKEPVPHASERSGKRGRNQIAAGQWGKPVHRATFHMATSEHV